MSDCTESAELGHWSIAATEHIRLLGWRRTDGSTPAQQLFLDWMRWKPTVRELVGALHRLNMLHACQILRNYVDEEPAVQAASRTMQQEVIRQEPVCQDSHLPMPPPAHSLPYPFPIQGSNQSQQKVAENHQRLSFPRFTKGYGYTSSGVPLNSDEAKISDVNLNEVRYNAMKVCEEKKMNNLESVNMPSGKSLPSNPPITQPSLNPGDHAVKSRMLIEAMKFPYPDIEEGTKNFHPENILGCGGFGVVYRVVLKNTLFAVKVLKDFDNREDDLESIESHYTELSSLFIYRHTNIIGLIGCSVYGPKTCLVYEFMANGSLEDRLQCKEGTLPLAWQVRHEIMMGAARGLQYLHTAKTNPLIHGDIKSANILLSQNMEAKLSDFGQARQATGCSTTGAFTHADMKNCPFYSTRAYLPRNFFNDTKLSIATDTFSYGVVIFEVCTGQKAHDPKRRSAEDEYLRDVIRHKGGVDQLVKEQDPKRKLEEGLDQLVKEQDPKARDWPEDLYKGMMELGLKCTEPSRKARPEMTMVLGTLLRLEGDIRVLEVQAQKTSLQFKGLPAKSLPSYAPSHFHLACEKYLQPPTSIDLSRSLGTLTSKPFDKPTGMPVPEDDTRYFEYDTSKLTNSEKLREGSKAAQKEADLVPKMGNLRIVFAGSRAAKEFRGYNSLAAAGYYPSGGLIPPVSSSLGSSLDTSNSTPYQLQRSYDLARGGNPCEGLVLNPTIVTTTLQPKSHDSEIERTENKENADSGSTELIQFQMALMNNIKKKSFPFQSDCIENQGAREEVTICPQELTDKTESPMGSNRSSWLVQSGSDIETPQVGRFQTNQIQNPSGPPQVTPRQYMQVDHQTPANQHQISTRSDDPQATSYYQNMCRFDNKQRLPQGKFFTSPTEEGCMYMPSRLAPVRMQAATSLKGPDSGEIHSSDLNLDIASIQSSEGRLGPIKSRQEKLSLNSGGCHDDNAQRKARTLELPERYRQLDNTINKRGKPADH